MNVEANLVDVLVSVHIESRDAMAALHRAAEIGPELLSPRSPGPDIGDKFQRGYNGGALERPVCS